LHKLSKDDIEGVVGEKAANAIASACSRKCKYSSWWWRCLWEN